MFYKIKYSLVPTIRMNQKNNKKYKAEKWLCPDCATESSSIISSNDKYDYENGIISGYYDDQNHVQFSCSANESLRQRTNSDDSKSVVDFFQTVVNRRKNQNRD